MGSEKERQHGNSGPPPEDVPQPSHAERARTLVHLGGVSTLATHSEKHPGFPFGSVMPYGVDDCGEPTFLISSMAMHTQNLRQDARATLLVVEAKADHDPLALARVSLIGEAHEVSSEDLPTVRESYLRRHPAAAQWVDFTDFSFFRLALVDVYFVGGFGVMGWVTADGYRAAAPDPLADAAEEIMAHMNDDHAEAMLRLAERERGIAATSARMTAIDRLGFHVLLQTEAGPRGTRIAFTKEATSTAAVRSVLIDMLRGPN